MNPNQPKGNYRGKKKPQGGQNQPRQEQHDAEGSTSGQSVGPPQGQPQEKKSQQGQGGGGKYKQKQLQKQQQQELQQQDAEGAKSGGSVQTGDPLQGQQQGLPQQGQGGGNKYKQKQLLKQQQQQQLLQEAAGGTQILLPSVSDTPAPSKPQPTTSSRGVLIRPNAHGSVGNPVKLHVNYFALNLDKLPSEVYHYDVDIQPATSRKWLRACFKRFCAEKLANELPFDGKKNSYAVRKVENFEKVEVGVMLDNRERRFTVSLKLAAVIDLRCLKGKTGQKEQDLVKLAIAKQCLETVFGTAADRGEPFVKFNRSIYRPPPKRIPVGANHELWYGLHQAVIIGSKLFLNVDVAHKAFPSGVSVLKVVGDLARSRRNDPPEQMDDNLAAKVHLFLKGLELSYTGPNAVAKVFKYNGLKGPASRQTFKLDDGTQPTVAAYFAQQGCRLRHPDLPVMHVGSTIRNVMLPMELCQILPGQALSKKHPDECTAEIMRHAATDTSTRKGKIVDFKNKLNYNESPIIKEFGIRVGKNFEEIDGRILDAPDVVYKNRKVVPRNGKWDAETFVAVNQRELRWVILNLDNLTRQNEIDTFGRNIFNVSKKKGMQLQSFSMQNNYCEPRNMRMNTKQLENELVILLNDFKKQQVDIAVVVLPDIDEKYSRVKQKAELVVGILTQCIRGKNITKALSPIAVVNNLMLKINTKTNGTNHVVPLPFIKKRVMFVGADVTHPSPEQSTIPSVVGVAASYSQDGFRYSMCYRLQDPKEEMIHDLEAIMKRLLTFYQKANNQQLPEMIMYYRDGVSDGQFEQVLSIELNAIHRAAAAMNPTGKINVTFVVVQKRHHTRFFPGPGCPTEGESQNVPPGTVVDKYITMPNHFQFFMISHQAVQGVAKPSKYTVLYDDERWDVDKLEKVTNALCHTYARCTRAVSYPTPTYYAHWIAERGKVYIQGQTLNMENLEQENNRLQIRREIADGYPMFFV